MKRIKAVLKTIRFSANGFLIGQFSSTDRSSRFVAKGNLGSPRQGAIYELTGEYKEYPKYGETFLFNDYKIVQSYPTDINAIASYLVDNIRGVGRAISQNLVAQYGEETLSKLKQDPSLTANETNLSLEICERIQGGLLGQEREESADIAFNSWLMNANAPRSLVSKIKEAFGCDIDRLKKNPYQMIPVITGMSFRIADDLAVEAGLDINSIDRVKAACEHAMKHINISCGHTCVELGHLLSEVHELIGLDYPIIEEATDQLVNEKKFSKAPNDMIGFARHLQGEQYIAENIMERVRKGQKQKFSDGSLEHFDLSKDQHRALLTAMNNPVFVLTGEAGSGKTTCLKAIIENLSRLQLRSITSAIMLLAPTGRAAKRASLVTRIDASTIHKCLEGVPKPNGGFEFRKNEHNKITAHVIIVDEATMIGVDLMVALLKAVPSRTKLIFVGDTKQLPPVDAGKVFEELLNHDQIPSVRLDQIHRQDRQGQIVKNARLINRGMPMLYPTEELGNDLYFWGGDTPKGIIEQCVDLMLNRIPKKFPEVDLIHDVQIIVPSPNKGALSAKNFNSYIQKLIKGENPNEFDAPLSWLGDKVINTKNDSNLGIVNGDIGTVVSVSSKYYIVEFEEKSVEIPRFNHNLQLAYAVSCHRYQGSQSDFIILPIHTSYYSGVATRNWFYTALTRAKKMCFLVGQWKATNQMISRQQPNLRQTSLGLHLNWDFDCENNN